MEVVRSKFEHDGYQVEDVHLRRPFDLLCTKGRLAKHVEVEGTQSDGSAIILTVGELEHVRKNPRHCVLCVVLGVKKIVGTTPLGRTAGNPASTIHSIFFRKHSDP